MGELYSGILTVQVVKGSNLVIRDMFLRSSDPYVVLKLGKQEKKTHVIRKNLNPRWDEELKFHIMNSPLSDHCSLAVEVWDKDRFPKIKRDDSMGVAEIDLKPLLEVLHPMGNGKKVVAKSYENCLDKDSNIVKRDGRLVQEVCLKLDGVQSGLLDLTLVWQLRL